MLVRDFPFPAVLPSDEGEAGVHGAQLFSALVDGRERHIARGRGKIT